MDEENQIITALSSIKEEIGSDNISRLVDKYGQSGIDAVSEETKKIVTEIVTEIVESED